MTKQIAKLLFSFLFLFEFTIQERNIEKYHMTYHRSK